MKRLTTRGIATATAIRDREEFKTNGSLYSYSLPGSGFYHSGGYLSGADLDQFRSDQAHIDYVVMSYNTPIAWHVSGTGVKVERWHKVAQKFSVTTSKHQGNLYMI